MSRTLFQDQPSATTAWLKGRDPQFGFGGWNLYAEGYKIAADELVAGLGKDATKAWQPEFLVYPICHLYHHYLELNLKRIWHRLKGYPRDPKILRAHNMHKHELMVLWAEVRIALNLWYGEKLEVVEAGCDQVEVLLKTLDDLDRSDQKFRYPVDFNGDLQPLESQLNFNLLALRDHVNEIAEILKPHT